MSDTVRTRFAPSPTGYLHIGGARTALFNYLLARRHGGRFVLRIEDTDRARNIAGAEQKLLDDMRWLGLTWDEGPHVGGDYGSYHQSGRLESYRAAAERLVAEGKAYYALETREELDAMRRAAKQAHGGFRYPRPERFPTEDEVREAREEGRPVVVRFATPKRDFVVEDRILGRVQVSGSELDDFVILKADGWPTYHFAVVLDDEAMGITHVLRGQEHLNNTPRHLALQEALGYRAPIYAHLPIILTMEGAKMSKREKDKVVRKAADEALKAGRFEEAALIEQSGLGTPEMFKRWRKKKQPLDAERLESMAQLLDATLPEIDIHDFRRSGYTAESVLGFIALLGWSPGDGRERMSLEELAAAFSVERVGKTSARFDRGKLIAFNTDTLAETPADQQLLGLRDYIAVNEASRLRDLEDATLARLLSICQGFRTYADIELKCGALFTHDDEVQFDPTAVTKVLEKNDGDGLSMLREVRGPLSELKPWDVGSIEAFLKSFAGQREIKLGRVAQPLRVAATGTTVSPPIYDTLDLLGRERTLARIDRALDQVAP